jgi:hypothetical protein
MMMFQLKATKNCLRAKMYESDTHSYSPESASALYTTTNTLLVKQNYVH